MILVDTSVWIDFFNNKASSNVRLLEKYLKTDRIIIGDIIKIELLQGFKSDKDAAIAKRLLSKLGYVKLLDNKTVDKSIEIYRHLKREGITIRKTIDTIIAAYCITNHIKLLHNDRDFDYIRTYFPLKVVNE